MKRICLLISGLLLSLGVTLDANAQKGQLGIGIRMTPDGAGFTGKYFLDNNLAFEGQMNAGGVFALEGQSVTAVGLLEYHIPLPDPAWRVFFGGGLHGGVWNHEGGFRGENGRGRDDHEGIFGITGIGGVEYRLRSAPFSFTADFRPAINFVSEVDFFPHNMFGVAVRYHLR